MIFDAAAAGDLQGAALGHVEITATSPHNRMVFTKRARANCVGVVRSGRKIRMQESGVKISGRKISDKQQREPTRKVSRADRTA